LPRGTRCCTAQPAYSAQGAVAARRAARSVQRRQVRSVRQGWQVAQCGARLQKKRVCCTLMAMSVIAIGRITSTKNRVNERSDVPADLRAIAACRPARYARRAPVARCRPDAMLLTPRCFFDATRAVRVKTAAPGGGARCARRSARKHNRNHVHAEMICRRNHFSAIFAAAIHPFHFSIFAPAVLICEASAHH